MHISLRITMLFVPSCFAVAFAFKLTCVFHILRKMIKKLKPYTSYVSYTTKKVERISADSLFGLQFNAITRMPSNPGQKFPNFQFFHRGSHKWYRQLLLATGIILWPMVALVIFIRIQLCATWKALRLLRETCREMEQILCLTSREFDGRAAKPKFVAQSRLVYYSQQQVAIDHAR